MSAASARPPRVGPERCRAKWVTIILFLLPALALYVVFVLFPIVQAAHYSLYKWNGLQPLTDFIGLKNYETALNSDIFRAAVVEQPAHHRPVADAPDPVLAAAGRAAQPALPRPGDLPADLLPAVRPVRGDHGHRLQPAAPAGRARRHEPSRRRPGRPRPGLARRHQLRDAHPVRDHLVEVLRVPHDPAAGRACRASRARSRRPPSSTEPAAGRRSATSPCRSSVRRCGSRSSCR